MIFCMLQNNSVCVCMQVVTESFFFLEKMPSFKKLVIVRKRWHHFLAKLFLQQHRMAVNRFLICVELRLEWMTCFSFLTFPSAVKLDTMATAAHSFWHLFVLTSSVSSSHPCDFSWNPSWPVTHHTRCTANYWDLHNNHLLRRAWHKFSGLNTSVWEWSVVLFMCSLDDKWSE